MPERAGLGSIGTNNNDGDIDVVTSASLLSCLNMNFESDAQATADESPVVDQADEEESHPSNNEDPASAQDPRCIIVHQVDCAGSSPAHSRHPESELFLDAPRLYRGDSKANSLRGRSRIYDLPSYLVKHPEISFVVYRSYGCVEYHDLVLEELQRARTSAPEHVTGRQVLPDFFVLARDTDPALPDREYMEIHSEGLRDAMSAVQALQPENQALLSGWEREHNMLAPYLHFYHIRGLLQDKRALLPEAQQRHLDLLLEYLDSQFRREYDEADRIFEEGYVTKGHLHKLFGPSEVVVKVQDGHPIAMVAKHCPLSGSHPIKLDCEAWVFDGRFAKSTKKVTLQWPQGDSVPDRIPISSLALYPLRLDRTGMEARLRRRGEIFWSCRKRRFVGYDASEQTSEFQVANGRYMVDTNMYRQLHGGEDDSGGANAAREYLDLEVMEMDVPPPGHFSLLLPPTIPGFGFHDKKWRRLAVEHICAVIWNKKAFDRLVLSADKKDIIAALFKTHAQSAMSTDRVKGKDRGLIILLHGGPGTGKTLTAESVAELAEVPLYRLTSGDIGTDPSDVEKYLESVFYLGNIWGAAVLLDESDVFLEERSIADLQRNAVVSVILRAMEYYEGILILTSNRVGTFDESLKSHVQLAIHFPSLGTVERRQLWQDFVEELTEEGDGKRDIRIHIDELSRHKLNGRQIGNAIRTARRLAFYHGQVFRTRHIMQTIGVVQEFDEYLNNVYSDADWAREEGIR